MPVSMLLNVVDVEATCWEGPPPPGQLNEIIEIGLTVLDIGRGQRLSKNRVLVRPEQSTVSPFCTQLTGLTQEQVEHGVTFAEACRTLTAHWGTDVVPWASWGDYDRKQFTRQCERAEVVYPFTADHTNAKARFAVSHSLHRPVGMARALDIAGLALEGRHHRGDDDSWNIAALILHLVQRGNW